MYCKLLQGKLDLLPNERRLIEPVLVKYAHVLHDEEANKFKGTDVREHETFVGVTPPIRLPQYRVPYALRDKMKRKPNRC